MSEDKMVIVARLRPSEFIVNYIGNEGSRKRYVWVGSKGDRFDKKPIPQYIVDDLTMTGTTFSDGELVVLDDKNKKIDVDGVDDVEKYKNNTNSKKEIEIILNKSISAMKKDFLAEKQFVIQVAKDIDLDSKGKIKFLSEWLGVKEELLFD